MNLLLDTHTLIWFAENDPHLSSVAQSLIESPENSRFVSIASFWEMGIKVSLGKLNLSRPFEEIGIETFKAGFLLLPISFQHTLEIGRLPFHHRDPFDRMIAAQALTEEMTLLSKDPVFDAYSVRRIWQEYFIHFRNFLKNIFHDKILQPLVF